MKNKTLEKMLINELTKNTIDRPVIVGDMMCSTTIALITDYENTYSCRFIIDIHYSESTETISLLNVFAIDGYISGKYTCNIENIIEDVNRRYNELTRNLESELGINNETD